MIKVSWANDYALGKYVVMRGSILGSSNRIMKEWRAPRDAGGALHCNPSRR